MNTEETKVTINVSDYDIELLEPWLKEFTTELYTNPVDAIVHEVLSKVVDEAKQSI
jgi:hypothetical protein